MLTGFKHLHSLNRYIILALILIVLYKSFTGWKKKQAYTPLDDKLNLFTFIFAHLQLTIGLTLYFTSDWVQFNEDTMANKILRFFTVEHLLGMLIAIALITVIRIKLKKITEETLKHKKTFIYYLIALIIIFASIPWPFRNVGILSWF
jgi:hypothetical protein